MSGFGKLGVGIFVECTLVFCSGGCNGTASINFSDGLVSWMYWTH